MKATQQRYFRVQTVQCQCICDRIVCRTGKMSGSNSSGEIVVTIDGMNVVWKTKFTYQVNYVK